MVACFAFAIYVSDGPFCFNYCDGVSDLSIINLIAHHRNHGRQVAVKGVHSSGRYGAVQFGESDSVHALRTKAR